MANTQVPAFEELMANLAAGSDEAAWQLTEIYTPHILRVIRATLPMRLRRLLDSQDFAQAVWASLLIKRVELGRMESEQALVAYLARTARNKVVDACRRYLESQKRDISRERLMSQIRMSPPQRLPVQRRAGDENEPFSRLDSPSECAMLRERWSGILAAEPERNRQIIDLRLKGETFAQIATRLGIHEGTARRAVLQIVNKLSQ